MCGIAGLALREPHAHPPGAAAAVARKMADTLVHRGPDDAGVWESGDGSVALAHRRLAILDLSPLGRNPMAWDGGRLWMTYNGEVYNFLELRRELEGLGHRFVSRTDTEVILAAYDQWGVECVERLAGMFAFALWDAPRRRLWVVRDRLGKKPLYYSETGGVFRFASELKALVGPPFDRAVDVDALRMYLRYGYVPSPHTIYRDARKLPPAHYLLCEDGKVTVRRYWDPAAIAAMGTTSVDRQGELEACLKTAVRQRMLADVPLGAFLSGGIDSSLIVALMQEQSRTPVRTFTIRFDNAEFNEADQAAAVARHLRTDHVEETCDANRLVSVIDRVACLFDEPFADSSAVPTFLLSRMARQHVTVALSGDGGDELFCGYPRYGYNESAARLLDVPRPLRLAIAAGAAYLPTRRLRRIADVLRDDDEDSYARFVAWWPQEDILALTGGQSRTAPLYADALARTETMAREDRPGLLDLVTYLPDDILTKVDRTSMAVSLEVRSPLLDHRVVELALRFPAAQKRSSGVTKRPLRQMLYSRVPRELVDRPKMGFGVPLGDWFRGPLREPMESYCAGEDLADLGLDPAPVRRLWADFKAGRGHRSDLVWQMFALVSWARSARALSAAVGD